jgi:hypothetical protein
MIAADTRFKRNAGVTSAAKKPRSGWAAGGKMRRHFEP